MSEPPPPSPSPTPCPSCGEPAAGRYCSSCGAPLAGARCASCDTALQPGARFCHACGAAVGAAASSARAEGGGATPWLVAGVAVLVVLVLVAGQRMWHSGPTDGATADAGPGDVAAADGGAMPRAPDISQMSPEERASRLYDRMMAAFEHGRNDTVRLFAPMAMQAYRMLDSLTFDERYDLGRLGEITGDLGLARAEADTILAARPTHLLGLILAAHAAGLRGDSTAQRLYLSRFVKAEPAELATKRPEYVLHANDISAAFSTAHQH